ncbi:MFS transporter [Flavobacterium sp.]|uniref:MFS transporter n=1 Tax=Flavobacterium sp. TaxID=239 RepID=UPI00260B5EB1|nr:MFS transporter [Flavobacterium sp.]
MEKRKLGFWEVWNMSFGFLGIQFGFALQGGFMSRIFQTLGAEPHDIPALWIAAPLTGLLVQPIIGYLSDNTWHPKYGRRKPYFLLGAILSSFALFFVPYSSTLWIAAGFLWILDASINISMEPFRALVADKLPETQRSYGFVLQTLIIGIGTWIASNLPWLVNKMGFTEEAPAGVVPEYVKIAFGIGALVFLISILYTIMKTKEYPPKDLETFKKEKKENRFVHDFLFSLKNMPVTMKKLGLIQFFSWFAFFTMWSMATPALTDYVYKAPAPDKASYDFSIPAQEQAFNIANKAFQTASDNVGSAMGIYGLSSMVFALLLTFYAAKRTVNRRLVHMFSLVAGGVGFLLMGLGQAPLLNVSFILIGISWGSILSMPYAMLSSSVDEKRMGMMMGLFNMFIVIPQIIAALGGINFLSEQISKSSIAPMILAGISLILGGLSNFLINDKKVIIG